MNITNVTGTSKYWRGFLAAHSGKLVAAFAFGLIATGVRECSYEDRTEVPELSDTTSVSNHHL